MRGAEVSIYVDYASPYAYFLAEAISGFQSRTEVQVQWLPIRLLNLSNFANGVPYSAHRIRYNLTDVPRGAEFYRAPFQVPSHFPTGMSLVRDALLGSRSPANA
jgi:2-hydroxychromene-2-carboxylate isomerase